RGEPGVRREVPGGREGAAVAEREEQRDGGPRADAGHGGEDSGQGMPLEQLVELGEQGVALVERTARSCPATPAMTRPYCRVAGWEAERGDRLRGRAEPAKGVRQGAGRVRDDERVARVGLALARVEVGDPAHGEPGEVGDLEPEVSGDRAGERPDRGRLVDDD